MTFNDDLRPQISSAAELVTQLDLDRFPSLVIYRCLVNQTDLLSDAAVAHLRDGSEALTEILTMPRRRFGSRPVEVLSPTSLILYIALVQHLEQALPEQSRRSGAWSQHREFGRTGNHSHVVELSNDQYLWMVFGEVTCKWRTFPGMI